LRFDRVTIALVGPEYPIIVGYIARLAKNFGIGKVYLIEPRFDKRVAMVYAAHGADMVEAAEEVSLEDLRKRHDVLIATTAISATRRANVNRLSIDPEKLGEHVSTSQSVSLVFGRDTTGLKNEELELCDLVTTIRTGTTYRTMNVSHSAAVVLYVLSKSRSGRGYVPDLMERETFARYSYELAVAAGMQEHRARILRKLSKRMVMRSGLDGKEVGLLVALMRKALLRLESH